MSKFKSEGPNGKEARIAFLDYLRIFAFLSVLIGHKFYADVAAAAENEKLHATLRLLFRFLMPFVNGGGAGVIVFFLVSGYIISQVLRFEQPKKFLIRRVFRIYPIYIVAVFIQIVIEKNWSAFSPAQLIPQLLLVGDFFNTHYGLMGVEWTLRIEIVFYLFVALLKAAGFYDHRRHLLISVLLVVTALISQLPPFPNDPNLYQGYFLIFSPFLFMGIGFSLYEHNDINFYSLLGLVVAVFANYFYLNSLYQPPTTLSAQFAALGFLIFSIAWFFRSKFQSTTGVTLLSNLTYPVYLFHNRMFDFFQIILPVIFFKIFVPRIVVIFLLPLVSHNRATGEQIRSHNFDHAFLMYA